MHRITMKVTKTEFAGINREWEIQGKQETSVNIEDRDRSNDC